MKRLFLLSILSLFLFSLVQANGIIIQSEQGLTINKTENIDYIINLTIKNTETFKFFNISSSNPIIQFDKFDLNSGENKTIQAKITTNSQFNGQIKIQGLYYQDIGQSNITKIVYISYNNGISLCNLNQVVGDKIIFVNQVNDEIKLKNALNNQEIAVMSQGENYTRVLNYPEELKYYATRIGLQFTDICELNSLASTGYVHNSNYDGMLNLNLSMIYNPTNLSLVLLTDYYNITYNDHKDDILQIKNIGNQKARNITLSGNWMTFNLNNFELGIGETKNVQYSISPLIYERNQTNKTYEINLNVKGNFENVNKKILVSIPYANIQSGLSNGTIDYEFLENAFRLYCKINPEFDLCKQGLGGANGTQRIVSAIFTEETIKDLLQKQAETQDNQGTMDTRQQEQDINQTNAISNLTITQESLAKKQENFNNKIEELSSVVIFIVVFILLLFFLGIALYLILNEKARNKISRKMGLHKGEATW